MLEGGLDSGMSGDASPADRGRGRFATTRWSLVLSAGKSRVGGRDHALEELCTQYWRPLYAYVRRRGYETEDARDLTQAFFAKLLEKRDLKAADPNRGRFRTFLLSSMRNFLAGQWRKEKALKRGGSVEILPLDFDAAEENYALEPSHELSPEAIYQRRWALSLLQRALDDLQSQYSKAGNSELFDALKGIVGGGDQALSYPQLSRRLGRSEGALRTAASRLRSQWRRKLHELVAETVADESEIQDELRSLLTSIQS